MLTFPFNFRQGSSSRFSRFPHAAVVSDNEMCSSMGTDILKRNGSAVDAAIMTLLCLGIVEFSTVGIGGGGHMTIYRRRTGKAEVIDFRECAPSGVKDDDFKKPWKKGQYYIDPKLIRGTVEVFVLSYKTMAMQLLHWLFEKGES